MLHAERKGKQIENDRRDITVTVKTAKKNIEALNKVLDNGITLKIKNAMGGPHGK